MLDGKQLLLVITGGIAAYKCLDLIRRLSERGASVRCALTDAARQFVTPLSLSALSQNKVYTDLFSLTDESEMGHIRLAREADLVVVAPATADILARMRGGFANDLASAILLTTDKPIVVAPAMNVQMWQHPATQENIAILQQRGVAVIGPNAGTLACGETGAGRMAEALEVIAAIETCLTPRCLVGLRALVTSGPTREPIDPVRYIANRSSGKQGHAIAAALSRFGARTILISGPVQLSDPPGVQVVAVETAEQMLAAAQRALPVDIAVCAAAVADWRVAQPAAGKVKKAPGNPPPVLNLMENPDILASLALNKNRPALLIGFAAETDHVVAHAQAKRQRKGADWILANDVRSERGVFGGELNTVHLVSAEGIEDWPTLTKVEVADRLVKRIARKFER